MIYAISSVVVAALTVTWEELAGQVAWWLTGNWLTTLWWSQGILHPSVRGVNTCADFFLKKCIFNDGMPYGDIDVGQHWLRYGWLPDGTKPLPEQMLINNGSSLVILIWGQFHRKCSRSLIGVSITNLRLHSHPSGCQWFDIICWKWVKWHQMSS